jgi:hypothetical protein
VVLELVEVAVDLRGEAADRTAVAPREEVRRLGMLEERVPGAVEEAPALEQKRGNPARLVTIQPPARAA